MLQKIRDYAQGFIASVIIGGLILSFALWGINEYFQNGDESYKVAVVNGEDINRYEYQIAYQNERARVQQMFGENFDIDSFDSQLKTSALDRVIDNAVVMQTAHETGFTISDEQVLKTIQGINAFQEEGKFSRAAYEQQLKTSGEPVAAFETRIRRAMVADQLIKGIASTGFATDRLVESTHKLQEQQRELAYFVVPAESFKKDAKIDDARIDEYYKINSDQYKTPELVDLEYVEVSADSLKDSVSVTDDELQEYFDNNSARFRGNEERKARHILIEGNSDGAKKKAEDIYQRVKKGEDFSALAKQFSQDPGSANEGGLLDFFGRGVMDKAFEEAAFKLKKGDVSEPVLSQFGYHIIKIEDVRGGGSKQLSDVRAEVEAAVKQSKADKLYFEKAEKLGNLAFETPESFDPIVDELKLAVKTTGFFGRNGGPGIAKEQKVITAAFSDDVLNQGLNSQALEIGKNRTVVVRKKEHKPAQVRPLAEVRSAIVNTLTLEEARNLTKKRGEELLAKVREGGDLKKVAQEQKFSLTEKAWFRRTDSKANNDVLREAFAMARPVDSAKPEVKGYSLESGDYAVIALTGVKDGDVGSLAADEKKRLHENLSAATGIDEMTMALKSLRGKADIKRFENNLQ